MREYKFRAWDKTREEMINVDMLLNAKNGMQQYRVTRPLVNGCLDVEFVKEDTILMQYTGLKDKNGVETYEGDIAIIENYNHHGKNPKKTMIIYYDNSSTQFCCKIKETNCKIDDLIMENQPLCFAHSIEVIGNIYENPELL